MANTQSEYYYATVAYADIFSYPLTSDDIYYWFIRTIPKRNIIRRQIKGIQAIGSYRVLRGRQPIIAIHARRERYAQKKWEFAKKAGWYLRCIPTIQLVGVTGGLAMRNTDLKDDIDLFIITSRGALWTSRMFAVLLMSILGKRRRPGDTDVENKICLNMFMSEESLQLPKQEQDLFSAHEVLQMEPLWSREDTYKKFLTANKWVKKFLPVAWGIKKHGYNMHPKMTHWWTYGGVWTLRMIEEPARAVQLWYMRNRRTIEVLTRSTIRFHPQDARTRVKREYEKRLAKANIPLDNVFYAG